MLRVLCVVTLAVAASAQEVAADEFISLLQAQALVKRPSDATHNLMYSQVRQRQLAMFHANRKKSVSLLAHKDGSTENFAEELKNVDGLTGAAVGQVASLSEAGYQAVVAAKSRAAMEAFVYRVLAQEKLVITKQGDLPGVLPYYDGECAEQSLSNLRAELHRGQFLEGCREPWIAPVKGSAMLQVDLEADKVAYTGSALDGTVANLNDEGYLAVAASKSNEQMKIYISRVLAKEGLEVGNLDGLKGFVPYFSGECATQSYTALVKELRSAAPASVAANLSYSFSKTGAPSEELLRKAIAAAAGVELSQIRIESGWHGGVAEPATLQTNLMEAPVKEDPDAVAFTVEINTEDAGAISRIRTAAHDKIMAELAKLMDNEAHLHAVSRVGVTETRAADCGGGWVTTG